jgi:hypothetical protein
MEKEIKNLLYHSSSKENALLNILDRMVDGCEEWHPFNHEDNEGNTDSNCYRINGYVKELNEFLRKYYSLFVYLEIDPNKLEDLKGLIESIKHPEISDSLDEFKDNVDYVREFLKDHKKEFFQKAQKFSKIEATRLNEAVQCFDVGCFLASTVLAVSTIESRLKEIVKKKDPEFYSKIKNITIGNIMSLIEKPKKDELNESKEKLVNIIPQEHFPLIELLRVHRNISAHADEREINFNLAKAILSLSFSFLLDDRLNVENSDNR